MVVRGLFTEEEVEDSKREISVIVKNWFEKLQSGEEEGNDWEEIANR